MPRMNSKKEKSGEKIEYTIATHKKIKYLGIYLTKEVKKFLQQKLAHTDERNNQEIRKVERHSLLMDCSKKCHKNVYTT